MRNADNNIIQACEFVHSKGSTIKLDGCTGIIVNSSLIEAVGIYAVEGINATSFCIITGNCFDVVAGVKTSKVENVALDGADNVVAANASRKDRRLPGQKAHFARGRLESQVRRNSGHSLGCRRHEGAGLGATPHPAAGSPSETPVKSP